MKQQAYTVQTPEQRILQLEEALDIALAYLEDIMGSDFDDSQTVQYIQALYNNEETGE